MINDIYCNLKTFFIGGYWILEVSCILYIYIYVPLIFHPFLLGPQLMELPTQVPRHGHAERRALVPRQKSEIYPNHRLTGGYKPLFMGFCSTWWIIPLSK